MASNKTTLFSGLEPPNKTWPISTPSLLVKPRGLMAQKAVAYLALSSYSGQAVNVGLLDPSSKSKPGQQGLAQGHCLSSEGRSIKRGCGWRFKPGASWLPVECSYHLSATLYVPTLIESFAAHGDWSLPQGNTHSITFNDIWLVNFTSPLSMRNLIEFKENATIIPLIIKEDWQL